MVAVDVMHKNFDCRFIDACASAAMPTGTAEPGGCDETTRACAFCRFGPVATVIRVCGADVFLRECHLSRAGMVAGHCSLVVLPVARYGVHAVSMVPGV